FDSNYATSTAGAIGNKNGSTTIKTSTFINNTASVEGGAIATQGNLNSIGNNYYNNSVTNTTNSDLCNGGAIATAGFLISLNDVFENNTGITWQAYGGAIYVLGEHRTDRYVNITNGTFVNNQAEVGGAVGINNATNVYINNSVFKYNVAGSMLWDGYGGAVFNFYQNITPDTIGIITIENSLFEFNQAINSSNLDNRVAGQGGAVFSGGNAGLIKGNNLTFNNNTADYGGAVTVVANINFTNSRFTNNTANVTGGAIFSSSEYSYYKFTLLSNTIVSYSNFTSNTAKMDAGAIYTHGSLTITNSEFISNSATNYAGAIGNLGSDGTLDNSGSATITDNIFFNNTATHGGAVATQGNLNSTRNKYYNNTANSTNKESQGGAIYDIDGNGITNILYDEFSNNTASHHGGAVSIVNATAVYINHSIFNSNQIINNSEIFDRFGGGVYVYGSDVTVYNTTFYNNTAVNGGALATEGNPNLNTVVTVLNSNFTKNKVITPMGLGGAIGNYLGILEVNNTWFEENTAVFGGGAIANNISEVRLTNNTFKSNSIYAQYSEAFGGAIINNGTLISKNNTYENNSATGLKQTLKGGQGGAIAISGEHNTTRLVSITQDRFINNQAQCGGAIGIFNGTNIKISNSTFISNQAGNLTGPDGNALDGFGGAIFNLHRADSKHPCTGDGVLHLNNNTFINNIAIEVEGNQTNPGGQGGAVFGGGQGGGIDCLNSKFYNNTAVYGGAINTKTTLNLTDSYLEGNNATLDGGAIYVSIRNVYDPFVSDNTATIINTTITKNQANREGGAIFSTGNITIIQSTLTYNNATNGGALLSADGNTTLNNNTITNNNATNGGALLINNNTNIKVNNTILDNNTATYGGAININGTQNTIISNSSFINNNATNGAAILITNSTNTNISYSIIYNNTATTGKTIETDSTSNITANYNWWGINTNSQVLKSSNIISDNVVADNTVVLEIVNSTGGNNIIVGSTSPSYNITLNRYNDTNGVLNNLPENGNFPVPQTITMQEINMTSGTFTNNHNTMDLKTTTNGIYDNNGGVLLNSAIAAIVDGQTVYLYALAITYINVVNQTTTYDNKINITVTIKDNEGKDVTLGNITITINNKNYTAEVENGTANVLYDGADKIGNYAMNVLYSDTTGTYDNITENTHNLTITEAQTRLNINNTNLMYKNTGIINTTVEYWKDGTWVALTNGTVQIKINGVIYTGTVATDGTANILYNGTDNMGKYLMNATYIATDINFLNTTNDTENLTITTNTEINVLVDNTTVVYGQNGNIIVNVTYFNGTSWVNMATGIVNVTIGGVNYTADVSNGTASIVYNGTLVAGSYLMNATFIDPNFINAFNDTSNLIVVNNAIVLNVEVDNSTVVYGQNTTIKVNVTYFNGTDWVNMTTGKVNITINSINYTANVTGGQANVIYNGMFNVNKYQMNVIYLNETGTFVNNTNNTSYLEVIGNSNVAVSVDNLTVVYGQNGNITVNVTYFNGTSWVNMTTGIVNVTIGGVNYTADVAGGQAIVLYNGTLVAGSYLMNVTFIDGDGNFANVTNDTSSLIVVNQKNNVTIGVSNVTVTYGEKITINVSVTYFNGINWINVTSGIVIININGVNYTANVTGGQANVIYNGNDSSGVYVMNVSYYDPSGVYNNMTNNESLITVNARSVIVSLNDTVTMYKTHVVIGVSVTYVIDGKLLSVNKGVVNITINGVSYLGNVNNGMAYIDYTGNDTVGVYSMIATFTDNEGYFVKTVNDKHELIIVVCSVNLNISTNLTGDVGSVIPVGVNVTDGSGNNVTSGVVDVYVNGTLVGSINVTNGVADFNLTVPDLPCGDYNVTISYHDVNYGDKDSNVILTIMKHSTKTTVENVTDFVVDENVVFNATIIDNYGKLVDYGLVVFKVNGQTIGKTSVVNGLASYNFTIPNGWSSKNYTISAVYGENNNYYGSIGEGVLTLNRINSYIETFNVESYVNSNITLEAVVYDQYNNTIDTGIVIFKINGVVCGNCSVVNGLASYNFTIPSDWSAKNYTLSAVYGDTNVYIRSEANSTLTINKSSTEIIVDNITVKVGETVNLTATVYNCGVVNFGVVIIKINGVSIGNTTVINGKINYEYIIPLDFKNKEYTLSMKYAENRAYLESKGNATITVKKSTTIIVNDIKGSANETILLKAKIIDEFGRSVTNGKVVFKINGKTIGSSTVNNGITNYTFTIPSDWSSKNYTITVVYGENNNYESSQANGTLTVNKKSTNIVVDDIDALAGTTVNLTATITSNGQLVNDGVVVIKINDKTIGNTTVIDGKVNYEYQIPDNFKNTKYKLTMKYSENKLYLESKGDAKITLMKQGVNITVNDVYGVSGETVILKANLIKNITGTNVDGGNAVFKIDGNTITKKLKVTNGIVTYNYTIPDNFTGIHGINFVYSGTGQLYSERQNATLIVN
ncbi:MAG: hypothetical protein Q4Q23_02420, partial [Methanobacteriaceae archaeon]|nr:hypothetical protein [Methanobacteriaceae archaeon]